MTVEPFISRDCAFVIFPWASVVSYALPTAPKQSPLNTRSGSGLSYPWFLCIILRGTLNGCLSSNVYVLL